jgi:hypothetical protein
LVRSGQVRAERPRIMDGMETPTRLPSLVRGTSAALIATFVALFSHVLGGGAIPGLFGIAVPLVLSLAVCTLLAGRKLSVWRLGISVVLSQTLFHTLFVLGTPTGGDAHGALLACGHQHGVVSLPMPDASSETVMLIRANVTMWASHLIGAVITVALLYRGEKAIHGLRDIAQQLLVWMQHRVLLPPRIPVRVRVPRVRASVFTAVWAVLAQICASTVSHRGPPRVALAVRAPAMH